jgi:sugar-specific transcriptional regulator TrmB
MENVKLLKRLGLTEYEARAYLALARLGPSTVREIVLDSKLPRNKAYEALQRLEDKGYLVTLPVSPKKVKISSPELLREGVADLNTSVNSLIKLIEQPKATEFKDLFWVIKGKKAIVQRLAVQNSRVKKEIVACNKLSKIIYPNVRTLKDAVRRGVKVRMICTFDRSNICSYKAWLKTGAEIRVFNNKMFGPLLPRMSIFDGECARLTIGRPEVQRDEDYITLWTDSKAFAMMLRSQFMNMWRNSEPIEKFINTKRKP